MQLSIQAPVSLNIYEQYYKPRSTYHKFDSYSNPIHISRDDVTHIVYLWGYKGQYPIAEIKNATYDQVKKALGLNPETLSSWDAQNPDLINSLRNNAYLPVHAQVTTYKYKPLVGITEVTDPRGVTTYYDYDVFGRLKESYIQVSGQKQITGTYDYHYRE
jgi:YD repeat-containing protein